MHSPTTCRSSPRPCSRTGCCSRPPPRTWSAWKWYGRHSTECPRCEAHPGGDRPGLGPVPGGRCVCGNASVPAGDSAPLHRRVRGDLGAACCPESPGDARDGWASGRGERAARSHGPSAAVGHSSPRRRGSSVASRESPGTDRPTRRGAQREGQLCVARTTMLMERRLVADGDERPLVVVDPREPWSEQALDQAVRAAASLCVHLARRSGCSLLLPGDRRATRIDRELYGFSAVHARLALLQAGAVSPPLGCLSGADTVLWVTAAARPAGVLAQLRTRVRYLVSPHPQAMWPVQFAVAGCAGQRLERGRGAKWMTAAERSVA